MEPIRSVFEAGWPGAEIVNILEDSLAVDRAKTANLTSDIARRIEALASYARSIGSDAVLFTCSAFGQAIEQAAAKLD
ncbi:MAG: arylsulfatase, partial [Mesorhizobium sp.]